MLILPSNVNPVKRPQGLSSVESALHSLMPTIYFFLLHICICIIILYQPFVYDYNMLQFRLHLRQLWHMKQQSYMQQFWHIA